MADQPAGESAPISDRIAAALMGEPKPQQEQQAPEESIQTEQSAVDETAEPEAASEPPAQEFEEIEVDGQKYQIPPELKEKFLMQADYTRKTQEVAEQRKAVEYREQQLKLQESERQFATAVAPQLQQIVAIDQQLSQFKQLDWNSLSTDEAFRYKLAHDQLKEQKAALEGEIGHKRQQWESEVQASYKEMLDKGMDMLKRSIPNFSEAVAKEILESAVNDGYTKDEISSIADYRQVKTLWKAMMYDKIQAQSKNTASTLQKVAPIGKAAPTNPMPQQTKEYLNYRKQVSKLPKGSVQHQAVVKDRIASIFGG